MKSGSLTPISKYEGIGGWLILVMISLLLTTIASIIFVKDIVVDYFQPEVWREITTAGSDFYHPLFVPIIIFEVVINCIFFVIVPIFLLVLMFKKNRLFPKAMIYYLVGSLILQIIDTALVVNTIYTLDAYKNIQPEYTANAYKEIGQSLIYTLIWVPYFQISKRVKATFLKEPFDYKPAKKETAVTSIPAKNLFQTYHNKRAVLVKGKRRKELKKRPYSDN